MLSLPASPHVPFLSSSPHFHPPMFPKYSRSLSISSFFLAAPRRESPSIQRSDRSTTKPPTHPNEPPNPFVRPPGRFHLAQISLPRFPHETLQRFSLEAPDTPRVPRHDVRGCLEEASSMILKGLADSATGYDRGRKLGALFWSYVGVQVFVVRIQGLR